MTCCLGFASPFSDAEYPPCAAPALAHDFDTFPQRFLDSGRYTIPANETGLPIGVQLYGRWREETELLRAGAAVQAAIGTPDGVPRVHVSRL